MIFRNSPLFRVSAIAPLVLTLPAAFAADRTWINAGPTDNWNLADLNWDAGTAWNPSDNAIFGGSGEIVSLTTGITAGSLTFNSSGFTIAGNVLTLDGTKTVTVANAGETASFTTSIAGGTLNKEGAGTMVLNGANTLSSVFVNNGKLEINGQYTNNRLSNGAIVTVATGAVVDIKTDNPLPTSSLANATSFVLNGGTLTSTGGGHTHIGNVTLNGGTWTTGAGAGSYDNERWKVWGDVSVGAGAASTISGNGVGLVGTRTFTVIDATGNANADLVVTANLNNGENSTGGVIKEGAGRMNLGSSDYSGPTTVNNGWLNLNGTLRNTSGITVNTGATLETGAVNMFVGGHGSAVANSRVITVAGGTWLMNSSMDSRIGNVTLQNGGTWTSNRSLGGYDVLLGNTTTGAATVTVSNIGGNTNAATMNGSGGIHLGGVQNFDVADVTGNSNPDLTVSMILDNGGSQGGTGGINKTGSGTMAITTNATFTGGTTINGGTLKLSGGGGSTGTIRGAVTVNSGVFELAANDVTGYSSGTDRISSITINSGGTMHVSTTGGAGQNQTVSNCAITLNGGAITGVAGSTVHLFNNGTSINTTAATTPSTISGIKLGLRQNDTQFNIANGAANTDLEISAVIENGSSEGNHNLVKNGDGTLVLSGANTYTGTTTVSAGVLAVNGSLANTSTTINGGRLQGSGAIAGSVTVNSSGALAPGNSIESLGVGNLSMTGGSTFVYEALDASATGADLVVAGTLSLTGVTLDLGGANLAAGSWNLGDKLTLISYTGSAITSGFTGFTDDTNYTFGLNQWLFDYNDALKGANYNSEATGSQFVTLTVVPEPRAAFLGGLGVLALLRRRR